MSTEKLEENNIFSKLLNDPQVVLEMAIEMYAEAEQNARANGDYSQIDPADGEKKAKFYEATNDEFIKVINRGDFFSTLDLIKNYENYHQAIYNWAPETTNLNVGVAAPFQGALLDALENAMIEQLEKKLKIYGDRELYDSFKNQLLIINNQDPDASQKSEASAEISILRNKILLLEKPIEELYNKIHELKNELIIYKDKYTTKQKDLFSNDSLILNLRVQVVKTTNAINEFEKLEKILLNINIPYKEKLALFEKQFKENNKILSQAIPIKLNNKWENLVEWVKSIFLTTPNETAEYYKKSLEDIKVNAKIDESNEPPIVKFDR